MSILIKNMQMPKNCIECPFMALANTTDGRLLEFCSVSEMFVVGIETQKDPKCPLVELPPHGDLIDRDAVLEILSDKNAAWDGYVKVKALPIVVESEG